MKRLFTNGHIFTSNRDQLYVQAMLAEDGKILWTGSMEEAADMQRLAGTGEPEPDDPDERVLADADELELIDLGGRTVIPGFVDAHMHPLMLAEYSRQIACLPPKINSIRELTEEIARVSAELDRQAAASGSTGTFGSAETGSDDPGASGSTGTFGSAETGSDDPGASGSTGTFGSAETGSDDPAASWSAGTFGSAETGSDDPGASGQMDAPASAAPLWICGWGYDEGKYEEQRPPNRWDLDAGCSDKPVFLVRSCEHIRCVNSKALEIAGITRDTPDPPGGTIDRDENGEPTGILRENARDLVLPFMPAESEEEIVEALVELGRLLSSQGIVAVADMGNLHPGGNFGYYEKAAERGFAQRVSLYYMWDYFMDAPETIFCTPDGMGRDPGVIGAGGVAAGTGTAGDDSAASGGRTARDNRVAASGISTAGDDSAAAGISTAGDDSAAAGISTAGDDGVASGGRTARDNRVAAAGISTAGEPQVVHAAERIDTARAGDTSEGDLAAAVSTKMDPGRRIRIAGLKLIGDGSISGRTAWLSEPYLGTEECGMPVYSDESLEKAIAFAREIGCQISVHAMGGRAIDRIIERMAEEEDWIKERETPGAAAPNADRSSKPPFLRIEHLTEPSVRAMQTAAEKGFAFVSQPIFEYCEIETYRTNMNEDRLKRLYPHRTELAQGVRLALSTDAPATSWAVPSDPFSNLKSAVTRRACDGTDIGQAQRLDIETAVILYTKEAAEVCGFAGLGQLAPGCAADFAILSEDIFAIDPDRIDQVRVEETYIEGMRVY